MIKKRLCFLNFSECPRGFCLIECSSFKCCFSDFRVIGENMFNQDLEVVFQQSLVKPRNPIWHFQGKCKLQGEINMLQEMSKKNYFGPAVFSLTILLRDLPASCPPPPAWPALEHRLYQEALQGRWEKASLEPQVDLQLLTLHLL